MDSFLGSYRCGLFWTVFFLLMNDSICIARLLVVHLRSLQSVHGSGSHALFHLIACSLPFGLVDLVVLSDVTGLLVQRRRGRGLRGAADRHFASDRLSLSTDTQERSVK